MDYSELKQLADRAISDRRFCGDENHKALAEGVTALIAEIEFLTESRQEAREERNRIGDRHDALEAELDQLKAENEALRKDAERWRYARDRLQRFSLTAKPQHESVAIGHDKWIDSRMELEALNAQLK